MKLTDYIKLYQITLPTRLANNSTDVKKQQNSKVIAHPAVIA
jgi:hypothetical protein